MTTTDDTGSTVEPKVDGDGDAVDTQVSATRGADPVPRGSSNKTPAVPLNGRVITPTRIIPADGSLAVDPNQEVAAPAAPPEARAPLVLRPQKARLLSNTRHVDLVGQSGEISAPQGDPKQAEPSVAPAHDAVAPPADGGVVADHSRGQVRPGGQGYAGDEAQGSDRTPDADEEEEVEVAKAREPKQRTGRSRGLRKPRSFSSDVPGSKHLPGFLDTPWRRFLLFWGTAAGTGSYAGIRVWFSQWANDPVHQVDGVLAYAITLSAFTIGVLLFRATTFNPFALFGLLVLSAWLGSTYGPDLLPLAYPHTAKVGISPYSTKLLANAIGLIGPMAWWVWLLRRRFWLLRWLACALLSSSILACVMFTTAP